MESNLLLEQYSWYKKLYLEESPFKCLLNADIELNPHQINAFCAAIQALKTGGIILAEDYENANNCKNLIEEIADVEIMTYQLKYLLKAYADVEKVKTYKIKRTLKESGLGDSRESE